MITTSETSMTNPPTKLYIVSESVPTVVSAYDPWFQKQP